MRITPAKSQTRPLYQEERSSETPRSCPKASGETLEELGPLWAPMRIASSPLFLRHQNPCDQSALLSQCQRMLDVVDVALESAPTLERALEYLPKFSKHLRALMQSENAPIWRVQRICQECLEQIAKIWGYDQPKWLEQSLPLIGYRETTEPTSESAFEQTDARTDALAVICQCATLAGNLDAINVAMRFIPSSALEWRSPSLVDPPKWGLRHFKRRRICPAVRVTYRREWIGIECFHFRRRYGTLALMALREISAVHRFTNEEFSDDRQTALFEFWAFRDPKVSVEVVREEFSKRTFGDIQLALREFPSLELFQRERAPRDYVSAHLLKYFPLKLMHRRLADLIAASSATAEQQHAEYFDKLVRDNLSFKTNDCMSMLGTLGAVLYGVEAMGLELREFCLHYLDEAEGLLKSRRNLQDAVNSVEIEWPQAATSPFDMAKYSSRHRNLAQKPPWTSENRMHHLRNCGVVCALISHLFQIQLHLGGTLNLKGDTIDCALRSLKVDLELLAITDFTWEHLALSNGASGVSIVYNQNAKCTERAELLFAEQEIALERSKQDLELGIAYYWGPPHEISDEPFAKIFERALKVAKQTARNG